MLASIFASCLAVLWCETFYVGTNQVLSSKFASSSLSGRQYASTEGNTLIQTSNLSPRARADNYYTMSDYITSIGRENIQRTFGAANKIVKNGNVPISIQIVDMDTPLIYSPIDNKTNPQKCEYINPLNLLSLKGKVNKPNTLNTWRGLRSKKELIKEERGKLQSWI